MNKIQATVAEVRNLDSLYIVTFTWHGEKIKMVSLDLDQQLGVGDKVILGVNFTSVAVAKNFSGELSYTNQLNAKIEAMETGELLSVVTLSYEDTRLESLILTDSVDRLALQNGDAVTMIIKANDIFLVEVVA